jgi:hypothetical protein
MTTGGTAKSALRLTITSIAITATLTLAGCSSSPEDATTATGSAEQAETTAEAPVEAPAEPLDLAGEWKQTNGAEDSYQSATITADTITVNWVNAAESTTALYWAGTYVAPLDDSTSYTWDSDNDTAQTDTAILASGDPTKTFTFTDGVLSYDVTAMGVTKTVTLELQ